MVKWSRKSGSFIERHIGMDSELKSFIKIFITGCLWGTIGLFVKLMEAQGSSSSYTSFLRLFFGFCLLVLLTLFFEGPKAFLIGRRTLLSCILLGIVSHGNRRELQRCSSCASWNSDRYRFRFHLCDDSRLWQNCHAGRFFTVCSGHIQRVVRVPFCGTLQPAVEYCGKSVQYETSSAWPPLWPDSDGTGLQFLF